MALIRQADTHQHFRNAVALDLGDLLRQGEQIKSAATAHASKAIVDAEAQRAKLLAGAAEEGRAMGLREGHEQGLQQGTASGREAALQESKKRISELEAGWVAALARFENDRVQLLLDANQSVIALATQAAQMIVKRVITLDQSIVRGQLEAVLATLAKPTKLRVRLCAADEPIIRAAMPSLMQRYTAAEHVEIVIDSTISRGGCIAVSASGGEIDASIETQLQRIVSSLLPDHPAIMPPAINTDNSSQQTASTTELPNQPATSAGDLAAQRKDDPRKNGDA